MYRYIYTFNESLGCLIMVIKQCPFSMAEYPLQSHTNIHFQEIEGDRRSSASLEEGSFISPRLGLKLTLSPSFIKLIETKLAESRKPKRMNDLSTQSKAEKMKAANFTASLLKIGSWERYSKNEGDLVGKIYFAKRKLVWEALEVGLKTKIEIQWSDISAIRVQFHVNNHTKMEIELNQPPSFFRETNPQPRKHTIWEQASDFTGDQATICRKHTVYFPRGSFEKPYEKLLLCDRRLLDLSKKPFPSQEYSSFHQNPSRFPDFPTGFNGRLPELSHIQPNYQVQNCQATSILPAQINNFKQNTGQPQSTIMNQISPMSVMDLPSLDKGGNSYHVYGNQWNNQRINNHMQVVDSIAMTTIQGNDNQNYYLNHGDDFFAEMNNPDNELDFIENHLQGDPQATYDKMAFSSMYPPLDLQQAEVNKIPNLPQQTNHWLPPQQFYNNITDHPQQTNSWLPPQQVHNNNMNLTSSMNIPPYSYVGPSQPTIKDFAALAGRQNIHHWNQ